jgi:hypothetical protein
MRGREGEICLVGFSSRKGDITIYGLGGSLRGKDVAEKLGKYKTGTGCLYVRRLSDIDTKQLTRLARAPVTACRMTTKTKRLTRRWSEFPPPRYR